VWAGQTAPKIDPSWPKDRFHNLIGKTSLLELPLIIQKATIVVANDSGPMHIAAAMSKPLLALFGPTDPLQYGPYPLNSPFNNVALSESGRIEALSANAVLDYLLKILK
jgi:heptosyltransferase-1